MRAMHVHRTITHAVVTTRFEAMAYVESHQEISRHPKTMRLMRNLGVSKNEAIGLIHQLWWWAMDFAPDGDLSRFDAEDIAASIDYEGDPYELMIALVESGWLDKTPEESGISIHDWEHYGGKFVQRKIANAERMRNARAANKTSTDEDVQQACDARAAHVQESVPLNRTEQSINETIVSSPSGAASTTSLDGRFDVFWAAYPRKVAKDDARKRWKALKPSETLLAEMLAALAWQRCQHDWTKDNGQFIPYPAVWLNKGRWKDEKPSSAQVSPDISPVTAAIAERDRLLRREWNGQREALLYGPKLDGQENLDRRLAKLNEIINGDGFAA